ncbi:MAG: FtsQ-type POTRA domain-containing protein [Oscillospiraceae bacterium]|nr:FtsQ-type POTRA domain-containing protein [Oscillospiraceae bacterium]
MPQKRKKRRRRRGGLGRLLRPLSVVLAAVAVVAALTMFFKVDQVEVTGNGRYRAEEVIAASGVEQGDNLILLDRYGISQRLCRELPYINDVRINPKFPDTLLVEVTEAHASASIQGAGGWWLIDAGGEPGIKLLELVEESAAQDYLQILSLEAANPVVGRTLELPEESPITWERLSALLTAMEEHGMFARADNLDLSDPDTLVLNYDGRFRVQLFYDADFDYEFQRLKKVEEVLEPNERGTIRMDMKDDADVHFIPEGQ